MGNCAVKAPGIDTSYQMIDSKGKIILWKLLTLGGLWGKLGSDGGGWMRGC